MKTNFESFIFIVLILCNIDINSKPILPVGDSSFYEILLTQMKLSTKEKSDGFLKIMSLINELVDSASKSIKTYEAQIKTVNLNCSVQNSTLSKNYQELLDLRFNYSNQLSKLETIEFMQNKIANATETRNRIIKEKEIYIETFKKVYADYLKFHEEIKKAYPKVECIHDDFSKLLLYRVKLKLSNDDEIMRSMVRDDLKFCYNQIKPILVNIGELDDSELCIYREQLEKNYKLFNLENFPSGVNLSLGINNTLNNMNAYYLSKYTNFTNANKTIFTYETQISNLLSLILNFKKQLESLLKLRETLTSLVYTNERAINSTLSLINLLKKQCIDEINVLHNKISSANEQFRYYSDIKTYFNKNYGKLSDDVKKRYAEGSVSFKKHQLK